jgi:putative DNA primase/helicase
MHSIEREHSVLGGLMLDNSVLSECEGLDSSDFFGLEHGEIFHAINSLIYEGKDADVFNVYEWLKNHSINAELNYLNQLTQVPLRAGAMRGHVKSIRDLSARRKQAAIFHDQNLTPAQAAGLANAIAESVAPAATDWPELQPLVAQIEAQDYPIDSLPSAVRCAVLEVAEFVKAPIPLIASSALAALSLAIQAHSDVQRADKLHGPCGLFMLAIADSGERKSTCDGYFTRAIRDYEAQEREVVKPLNAAYKSEHEIWEAQRSGLKEKIKSLSKDGKPTTSQARELQDLDKDEPRPPRVPRLIYGDATQEALIYALAKQWPSGGVISSEAGSVFGGHSMGADSVMRNLAALNQLWDGAALPVERRSSESFTARGARLTMALQVQEETMRAFLANTKGLARGTGFLARFLVSWPVSTQGTRNFTEAPANWPSLTTFNDRLTAILNRQVPIDDDGGLTPAMLTLSPDAKTAWVSFHDQIESMLPIGGELFDVRDVASKTADNAARLAALFHTFTGSIGPIDLDAMEAAASVTAWHLSEAQRFLGELAVSTELANSARLEKWLVDYCKREKTDKVPTREVLNKGPGVLRENAILTAAVQELAELGRARLAMDGKKRLIQIRSELLA